eukprot:SM000001S04566  [mRNA]  locus=s1:915946:917919:- [translate_table: standard]
MGGASRREAIAGAVIAFGAAALVPLTVAPFVELATVLLLQRREARLAADSSHSEPGGACERLADGTTRAGTSVNEPSVSIEWFQGAEDEHTRKWAAASNAKDDGDGLARNSGEHEPSLPSLPEGTEEEDVEEEEEEEEEEEGGEHEPSLPSLPEGIEEEEEEEGEEEEGEEEEEEEEEGMVIPSTAADTSRVSISKPPEAAPVAGGAKDGGMEGEESPCSVIRLHAVSPPSLEDFSSVTAEPAALGALPDADTVGKGLEPATTARRLDFVDNSGEAVNGAFSKHESTPAADSGYQHLQSEDAADVGSGADNLAVWHPAANTTRASATVRRKSDAAEHSSAEENDPQCASSNNQHSPVVKDQRPLEEAAGSVKILPAGATPEGCEGHVGNKPDLRELEQRADECVEQRANFQSMPEIVPNHFDDKAIVTDMPLPGNRPPASSRPPPDSDGSATGVKTKQLMRCRWCGCQGSDSCCALNNAIILGSFGSI